MASISSRSQCVNRILWYWNGSQWSACLPELLHFQTCTPKCEERQASYKVWPPRIGCNVEMNGRQQEHAFFLQTLMYDNNFPIALKFGRPLDSITVELTVTFQSDISIFTHDLGNRVFTRSCDIETDPYSSVWHFSPVLNILINKYHPPCYTIITFDRSMSSPISGGENYQICMWFNGIYRTFAEVKTSQTKKI